MMVMFAVTELEYSVTEVENTIRMNSDIYYSAMISFIQRWRYKKEYQTDLDVVVGMKKIFENLLNKGGIYQRILGNYQIGKNDHPSLDEPCPENWSKKIHDVQMIGLFLCQHLSVQGFQHLMLKIMHQFKHPFKTKFMEWMRKEESDKYVIEPLRRVELLDSYIDMCKDEPEAILRNLWSWLNEEGKRVFSSGVEILEINFQKSNSC